MPSSQKILIIEDETPMRRVLKDTLEQEGFIVFESRDGVTGLQDAMQHRPDLILLDIVMPHKDGMRVLKELREDDEWGKDVPIVILTNLNDVSTVINTLEFSAYDQNNHPKRKIFSSEMARKCIKRYLNTRLQNGVEDFLIKTDSSLEDIVNKIKTKLKN